MDNHLGEELTKCVDSVAEELINMTEAMNTNTDRIVNALERIGINHASSDLGGLELIGISLDKIVTQLENINNK
jgi:hypothetical protein